MNFVLREFDYGYAYHFNLTDKNGNSVEFKSML